MNAASHAPGAAVSAVAPLPAPESCPACGVAYIQPDVDGSWLASVCYPPSSDMPIPGSYVDIPAWCAVRQAFVWIEDGKLVCDR